MLTTLKTSTVITFILTSLACSPAASHQDGTSQGTDMNILIESADQTVRLRVSLADNPSACDFLSQLPLTLKAEDYANSEKIAYLPKRLSTQDAPDGHPAKRGDFTYYAPWGNLAMFYKDFKGTAPNLVYLGKITEGVELLEKLPAGDIRIHAIEDKKTSWTAETLQQINTADDLKIAPHRANGQHGTPTWIWEVVVDGRLFVRAYSGIRSSWYQSAVTYKTGIIQAIGQSFDVRFEPIHDEGLNQRIDAAYRAKYAGSPYTAHMVGASARAATVEILLR